MSLYRDIYKLCTATPQPYSEELYLRLRAFLERHVGALRDVPLPPNLHLARRPTHANHNNQDMLEGQGDLLADYLKKWEAYSTGSEYCHHIFRYLVRTPFSLLVCAFVCTRAGACIDLRRPARS